MVVLRFQAIPLPCLLGCLQTRSALASPALIEAMTAPGTAEAVGVSACPHLSHPQFAGAGTRITAFGEQGLIFLLCCSFTLGCSQLWQQGAVLLRAANPSADPNPFSASSSSSVILQLPFQAVHKLTFLPQVSSR